MIEDRMLRREGPRSDVFAAGGGAAAAALARLSRLPSRDLGLSGFNISKLQRADLPASKQGLDVAGFAGALSSFRGYLIVPSRAYSWAVDSN
jgi:hypothetical protein